MKGERRAKVGGGEGQFMRDKRQVQKCQEDRSWQRGRLFAMRVRG